MAHRLAQTPTVPFNLQAMANILLAASAEVPVVLARTGKTGQVLGTAVHGWDVRVRNRLVKEAGLTYNDACHAARDLWKARQPG